MRRAMEWTTVQYFENVFYIRLLYGGSVYCATYAAVR
jgi:hypothetical protein